MHEYISSIRANLQKRQSELHLHEAKYMRELSPSISAVLSKEARNIRNIEDNIERFKQYKILSAISNDLSSLMRNHRYEERRKNLIENIESNIKRLK